MAIELLYNVNKELEESIMNNISPKGKWDEQGEEIVRLFFLSRKPYAVVNFKGEGSTMRVTSKRNMLQRIVKKMQLEDSVQVITRGEYVVLKRKNKKGEQK